jgi:tRNA-binding EMAP/Myf-like protein
MEKEEKIIIQKPEVSVDSFYALDIRFCKIEEVEDILKNPKKEFDTETNPVKAYKLLVNTGFDKRDIVTNIVHLSKDFLIGTTCPFILNFPPTVIRGVNSKGMIFMISNNSLITGGEIGEIIV